MHFLAADSDCLHRTEVLLDQEMNEARKGNLRNELWKC